MYNRACLVLIPSVIGSVGAPRVRLAQATQGDSSVGACQEERKRVVCFCASTLRHMRTKILPTSCELGDARRAGVSDMSPPNI